MLSSSISFSSSSSTSPTTNSIGVVRIGYFANINHAQALIGIANGDYQKALGPSTTIKTQIFTAGPTEMTALLANQIDMAYVGPSPAVNSFIQSNGTALTILAGATSGGAVFVVRNASNIHSVHDLGGKTFAAPQLGNTQDIALRNYLAENGFKTSDNGGSVTIKDTSNSNIVTLMVDGQIDGAWVPEPYGSLILAECPSHVFVDERSLWPGGNFSTAELVVSNSFLKAHADVVEKIVAAHVAETIWINAHPQQAATLLDNVIANLTGSPIDMSVLTNSLTFLSFTYDPLSDSVTQQAQNAFNLGFLGDTPPNLNGLVNVTILNQVLKQQGLPQVGN